MVREIGTRARPEIEQLLGRQVFLELQVKVRPKWRRDETHARAARHLSAAPRHIPGSDETQNVRREKIRCSGGRLGRLVGAWLKDMSAQPSLGCERRRLTRAVTIARG